MDSGTHTDDEVSNSFPEATIVKDEGEEDSTAIGIPRTYKKKDL